MLNTLSTPSSSNFACVTFDLCEDALSQNSATFGFSVRSLISLTKSHTSFSFWNF